ncbi:MAG: 30S ribosomal protein S18 [Myxococcota bacterium]
MSNREAFDERGSKGDREGEDNGGLRRGGRRRGCRFCADKDRPVDYKDSQVLRHFITDRGKIVPRRTSGACAKHQRAINTAVKRARMIALIPFTQ